MANRKKKEIELPKSSVNYDEKPKKSRWWIAIIIVVVLAFFGFILIGFISLISSSEIPSFGANVALIPVKGVIVAENQPSLFGGGGVSSTETMEFIKKANENPNIKAIVFEINSPGGGAVASEEISSVIKKSEKPTVGWIREVGASGGYWVASSCDHIIAHEMSITGSIGVISSYLEFSGLLENYNVTYQRLVAGKYKDIGTPFKEMTKSEEMIFQRLLNRIHEMFKEEVKENRGLSDEQMVRVSDGLIYLGSEAKDLGLVDELGGKEEVVAYLEQKLETKVELVEYKKEKTFLDALSEVFSEQSFFVGQGLGESLFSKSKSQEKYNIFT